MTHTLACAFCQGGDATGTGAWWFFLAVIVILAIGCLAAYAEEKRRKAGKPPREPATDMSPFMVSLLSGRSVSAYTAPVRAVTPAGITVRQSRCCQRGHQSPAQAVAHAQVVGSRIARAGR